MKRLAVVMVAAACIGAAAGAALAQDLPGGNSSANLEYVKNIPLPAASAEGGRLVGDTFFATADAHGVVIYGSTGRGI